MTKFNLDENTSLEGKAIFDEIVKKGGARLKNFDDASKEGLADGEELIISTALSMPCFEVSTEVFDVVSKWVKENGKPYVDNTVETYLTDEDLKINTKIMKNNNANLVGKGEGLKALVGNELSQQQYSNLQVVLEGVPEYLRKDYAGKIGYILSQDMSVENGVERFNKVLQEDGIDLAEGIPDGPNINTSCWFYGEKIVKRLEKILEE